MPPKGQLKASGPRIVKIPRKVTKKNEEYMLDGYHYQGMNIALQKYCNPKFADQCCWLYEQRTAYKGYEGPPDALSIVGKIIDYDDEYFTVEIFKNSYFDMLPNPRVSISCIGTRDEETKTIIVDTITGIYVG